MVTQAEIRQIEEHYGLEKDSSYCRASEQISDKFTKLSKRPPTISCDVESCIVKPLSFETFSFPDRRNLEICLKKQLHASWLEEHEIPERLAHIFANRQNVRIPEKGNCEIEEVFYPPKEKRTKPKDLNSFMIYHYPLPVINPSDVPLSQKGLTFAVKQCSLEGQAEEETKRKRRQNDPENLSFPPRHLLHQCLKENGGVSRMSTEVNKKLAKHFGGKLKTSIEGRTQGTYKAVNYANVKTNSHLSLEKRGPMYVEILEGCSKQAQKEKQKKKEELKASFLCKPIMM